MQGELPARGRDAQEIRRARACGRLAFTRRPDDKAAVTEAKKFLKAKKATFTNVLLDEGFGDGFEKLNINAIPAVFVYGPDGKEVKRFTMETPRTSSPMTKWRRRSSPSLTPSRKICKTVTEANPLSELEIK